MNKEKIIAIILPILLFIIMAAAVSVVLNYMGNINEERTVECTQICEEYKYEYWLYTFESSTMICKCTDNGIIYEFKMEEES